jgi:hypothetical protein
VSVFAIARNNVVITLAEKHTGVEVLPHGVSPFSATGYTYSIKAVLQFVSKT